MQSDVRLDTVPCFSNENISSIIESSLHAKKFLKMKEGDSLIIEFGSCSNTYFLVKMTAQEIENLKLIEAQKEELKLIKKEIQDSIPLVLN